MRSKETTVIAAIGMAGSTTTTTTASAQSTTGGCASGLHLILARGTSEEIPGVQGLIADALGDLIPGTTVANLPYPASSEDPFYFESVFNGTMLMRSAVTEYIEACPESKIAVLGYSQVWPRPVLPSDMKILTRERALRSLPMHSVAILTSGF